MRGLWISAQNAVLGGSGSSALAHQGGRVPQVRASAIASAWFTPRMEAGDKAPR